MGPIRSYNQCRHRWHNVIKHRGNIPESEHRQSEDLAHEQWVASQQQAIGNEQHMLHSHPHSHSADIQHQQQMSSAAAYANLDKYDV
jgi:predicted metal-dependent phosphotriesterase family hydrolase